MGPVAPAARSSSLAGTAPAYPDGSPTQRGKDVLAHTPPYWIASLALYFVFYLANQGILGPMLEAMTRLNAELERLSALFRYLESYSYAEQPHLAELCTPFSNPVNRPSARRRISSRSISPGSRDASPRG